MMKNFTMTSVLTSNMCHSFCTLYCYLRVVYFAWVGWPAQKLLVRVKFTGNPYSYICEWPPLKYTQSRVWTRIWGTRTVRRTRVYVNAALHCYCCACISWWRPKAAIYYCSVWKCAYCGHQHCSRCDCAKSMCGSEGCILWLPSILPGIGPLAVCTVCV